MTIGKKLILSFAGLLALLLVQAFTSLRSIGNLGSELQKAANVTTKKIESLELMGRRFAELQATAHGLQLSYVNNDLQAATKVSQKFDDTFAKIHEQVKELMELAETDQGREALRRIEQGGQAWLPLHRQYVSLAANKQFAEAHQLMLTQNHPILESIQQSIDTLVQVQKGIMAAASANAESSISSSRWIAFSLIGLSFVIAAVVLLIVTQINRALRQITAELAEGSGQVASAAAQVSSSGQALAQGSSEQAASLEETSASSEEITSMTRKNAENSKAASGIVNEAERNVGEANRTLDQMLTSMSEINTSSDKISKIIKVIDEIAFQTNILALNAAVEAARAGEAGMGFAVVADEVKSLAQRSAQAAKDTAALIEESITKSNEGSTKLDHVAKAITSITENAGKIKTLVDEVNLGSQEQARGMEQIAQAISQMEQVTQKTAANAEESASAGEELSAQAETLNDIVGRLGAMVGGTEQSQHGTSRRNVTTKTQPQSGALSQLQRAIGPSRKPAAMPALHAAKANKSELPLGGDFTEF